MLILIVGKALEGTELALQAPSLMMGESLMDASTGFDTVKYREPMGVSSAQSSRIRAWFLAWQRA